MVEIQIGTGASAMRSLTQAGPAHVGSPVRTKPDIEHAWGKAWLFDLEEHRRIQMSDKDEDATVSSWLVEAPWAHPVWHSYSLILVHLRPLTRPVKTIVYLEGATHELWVHAVDPKADRNDFLETGNNLRRSLLVPMNYGSQMIEASDETAAERVRQSVLAICEGRLSPDTDHTRRWVELYGDNMFRERFQ